VRIDSYFQNRGGHGAQKNEQIWLATRKISNRVEDEQSRHGSDICISSFSTHFSVDSLSAKHDMHLIRALSRSISSNSKDGEASCTDLPPHRNRLWHGWQARGEISTILKDLITDSVGSLRVETPTESVVWWTGNDCNSKYQHTLSLIDAMDRCFLVSKSILKSDHFPGCARKKVWNRALWVLPTFCRIEIKRFRICGVGVPTIDGVRNVLDFVGAHPRLDPKHRVVWLSLREEHHVSCFDLHSMFCDSKKSFLFCCC